jgi:hypothetical protein
MNFSPVSSRYLEKSGTLGTVTSNIYTKLHSKIVDRGTRETRERETTMYERNLVLTIKIFPSPLAEPIAEPINELCLRRLMRN